ncbi:LysE family translocator [Parvularcula lutaonensis]|uniref:LysE family translocator n=1 Tax=Parvularcula lutaonensis TaxID=491923 RepID=A0ABV7ME15_9PROT|nr:LysE family transporter [Parvularcula lutaonensis]GGY50738.1 homoserine/homoserine lactone efflux protein [Parvularcula lutaonensis]
MLTSLGLLVLAAASILGSPGPAPLSLAATGASAGLRGGLPYLSGLVLAIAADCAMVALGLGALISSGGPVTIVLLAFSITYIVYIAWKIAAAPLLVDAGAPERVPSFRDGLILNLTNPKAYAAIAAVYAGFPLPIEDRVLQLVSIGVATVLVALVVDFAWLAAGSTLAGLFRHPRWARPLRVIFAALMLAAVGLSLAKLLGA